MASHPIEHVQLYPDLPEAPERPLTLERRKRARAQVHWPVCFSRSDTTGMVHSSTRDVSSGGFYCIAPAKFVTGETIECTLTVPTHHPSGGDPAMPVLCRVRIVRAEALGEDGFWGVGCQIEDYRFVNSRARL